MDMKVIETLSVNQLNMESVHGYRNRHRSFVILSFNKKAIAKTQQQLQEIQTKMRTGKEYKMEEICEITGLKRTRTRDLVKKLVVMGIVDESGDRKAIRYKNGNRLGKRNLMDPDKLITKIIP